MKIESRFSEKQRKNSTGRGSHPSSRANLKPFKPGECGNPGGLPKGSSITALLRRILDEIAKDGRSEGDAVARALVNQAKTGNVKAFNAIADRVEGRVPLPIAGPGGGPIRVEFCFTQGGLQTTEDELNAIDIEALEIDYDEGQETVNEIGDVP